MLIKSSRGHGVNESDIGALLKNVKELQSRGHTIKLEDETISRRKTTHISVEGEGNFTVDGIRIYHLWLDNENLMPVKVSAYNNRGKLIEEVLMEDLQINMEFPQTFFDL